MIGKLAPTSREEERTDVPNEEEDHGDDDDCHTETLARQHMRVFTHHDGMTSEKSMRDIYGDRIDGVTLRLLKKDEHGSIQTIDNVILGKENSVVVKKAVMKISFDSKFLAIFMKEINELKIFKIEELET